MKITRRAFLKGAMATGVAAATMFGTGIPALAEDATGEKKYSFETAPDPITDDQIAETIEADVIVVGAGTAGLVTAYSALQNGLNVVLISASTCPISRGGSNHAVYSKELERRGVERYDTNFVFRREIASQGGRVDQRKWYKFCHYSEEAMNWMIDIMEGAGFTTAIESAPDYEPGDACYTPAASHGFINDEYPSVGGSQQGLVKTIAAKFEEEGGTIYYSNIAKQLVREDENTGRVDAVIALREDGTYAKYCGSKAVVLATGDFSADREMMEKYCPDMIPFLNADVLDGEVDYDKMGGFGGVYKGDGQKMGLWIGAAWQKNSYAAPMYIGVGGATMKPYTGHTGLVMNASGERFENESTQFGVRGGTLMNQTGHAGFAIWDSNYAKGEDHWQIGKDASVEPATEEEIVATWGDPYDTLDDAIAALGLPADAAKATIERYNELCESGVDEDFAKPAKFMKEIKTAPFYVGKEAPIFLTVLGGLRTNSNLQVCDENDQPIPGLYNVGAMTGDMYANYYSFMMEGLNLGCCCITFGYLTGKYIAENE